MLPVKDVLICNCSDLLEAMLVYCTFTTKVSFRELIAENKWEMKRLLERYNVVNAIGCRKTWSKQRHLESFGKKKKKKSESGLALAFINTR